MSNTNFFVSVTEESVLRDLKALLQEAKQKVPPFLHQLDSLTNDYLVVGGTQVKTKLTVLSVKCRLCVH